MPRRSLGLLASLLALAILPPAALAAGPATVTVRVEGATGTLVPRTTLTTTVAPVVNDGNSAHACTGTSAAGALQQATAGAWVGTWSPTFLYSVDAIGGEAYPFSSGSYWGFFINNEPAQVGLCGQELQQGDEVLFAPLPATGTAPSPLVLQNVPAKAAPGQAVTVKVVRYVTTYSSSFVPTTSVEAVAGAAVAGAGSATTGADGTATVTLGSTAGASALRASKTGEIRSASEPICLTTGSDGLCGTTVPPCVTSGDDGRCGTPDRRSPVGKITSVTEGAKFTRRKAPRLLSGIVASDPSGIAEVRLRLTRRDGKACQTFDGKRERLVELKRCGAKRGKWFSAGDREQWSYLLPSRLGRGRWVLDVQVRDKAGNIDTTLQRTRNRVVFTVS